MTTPDGNHAIDSFAVAAGLVEGPEAASTRLEVAFVVEALGLRPGARVLDLPCGSGRHAIALAALGFDVTGVDVDLASIGVAREAAGNAVVFRQADVLDFAAPQAGFDAAISLFSCLGYLPSDAADRAMLRRLAAGLHPGVASC